MRSALCWKEFATYELIGMEAKTVRNLFLAENSIIGTGAFLLGSLVGTGLSGLLNQVVKNIFEVPHTYQVSFSLRAWAVTFLFFALMYGFGMLRAAKIIRHQKVIDLLYDNRKNALVLAKPLAQATGKKVEYSKHKGLTDKACESLIMTALRDHGELSRKEINELLSNSLSDILTDKQRYDKISNILRRMRLNGLITNRGAGNVSFWRMVNHS